MKFSLLGADVARNRSGDVIIDKTGHFLYACNRGTAEELQVSVFTRNRSTGLLTSTGNKYPVNKASCIVFA